MRALCRTSAHATDSAKRGGDSMTLALQVGEDQIPAGTFH